MSEYPRLVGNTYLGRWQVCQNLDIGDGEAGPWAAAQDQMMSYL